MATSLQNGINAAKAGRMDTALDNLKDAIIEEPQNADVWVWIAAIIDDLDKQEIFLEKALDIDPHNIPAQRGLAYLQKRKRDQAGKTDDHLSDHTRPISPFPASDDPKKREDFSGWSKISPSEILKFQSSPQDAPQKAKPSKNNVKSTNKLTSFEIGLLGVVVIVFSIIGVLAASAIFEFELPIAFLSADRPRLTTELPYPGVFLYENETFFGIRGNEGLPTSEESIPTSTAAKPVIALWQEDANPERMNLIYQNGEYILFKIYPGKGESDLIQPLSDLQSGLYCLQYEPEIQEETINYWCFKVMIGGENE